MRIAYLVQAYPPMISGAAQVAQQLAETMAQRGHQVLVIAASDKRNGYRLQNETLTILRLASIHNPLRVGHRFLFYPQHAVFKALREFQPEVLHAHEGAQMGLLGVRYAKHAQIPVALTAHQLPGFVASYLPGFFRVWAEKMLWLYGRRLAQKFTAVITPTQTISTIVTGRIGRHVNSIGYGLDLQTFHPALSQDADIATRKKWNLPSDVPLLLHVGRLDTDKRVDRVIHAAAQTMKETSAHLLIVGDGTQKAALIKLCRSLGISHRVHFTGFIAANQGLPEIYRIARLFIIASEIETQGIVLLEAAASGLPIVAVNATCIPEIVHHGINGFLAEPGDLGGLAKSMNLLLKDRNATMEMGQASRKLGERHAIHYTIDAHENLYRQMIEKDSFTLNVRKTRGWVKRTSS